MKLKTDAPDQLCYVLDCHYSDKELLARALKGQDAKLVSHLVSIATALNFGLYIADVTLQKAGETLNAHRTGGWDSDDSDEDREYKYRDEDEDEDEDRDVGGSYPTFVEVTDEDFTVDLVVDLVGKKSVDASWASVDIDDFIPWSIGYGKEKPDHHQIDGWMGRVRSGSDY